MPLFKLNDERFVNTEQVADISFTPGGFGVFGGSPGVDARFPTIPAYLRIELKTAEVVLLSGEEAETVWQAFQVANGAAPCESTQV
jgi:hypothetical protein